MDEKVIGKNNVSIYRLWRSFALSVLLFLLPVATSLLIPVLYYPFFGFAVSIAVYLYLKHRRKLMRSEIDCMIFVYIVNRALFFYSIISLISNLIFARNLDWTTEVLNPEAVFQFNLFPVLILSPLMALFAYQAIRSRIIYCVYCVACKGFSSDRNMCGILQSREALKVMHLIMINGILLTILGWGYFLFVYNRYVEIETFDKIVFIGVPVIILLINVIGITVRYLTITIFKESEYKASSFKKDCSIIRFIAVSKLGILVTEDKNNLKDSPLTVSDAYVEKMTIAKAGLIFQKYYGIAADDIKPLYSNIDKGQHSGIFRYIVFLDAEKYPKIPGKWIELDELLAYHSAGKLVRVFRNEIYRITVSITSYKMFDENGNRRYDKIYEPGISVSDIKNLDIDYSDTRWMRYAMYIDNRMSRRLKLNFCKYIEGVID